MSDNKLLDLSFDFAVAIVNLIDGVTAPKSSYMTDQLARAGTSVGANIHEAQYAHSKNISELAEVDWERDIPPEELNEMAEAINRMERERGGTDFVEMVTEPVHYVFYSDHAVKKISEYLNKGQIPKKGMAAWY